MKKRDLRGTWPQALGSLFFSLLIILAMRWALFEPYVIPSGSMLPTLLIRDHILVNKFAYGLRLPFSSYHLTRWSEPMRGDVVVFRSVETNEIFLVKRVVGLPGDKIQLTPRGLMINDKLVKAEVSPTEDVERLLSDWTQESRADAIENFEIKLEALDGKTHFVFQDRSSPQPESNPAVVPEGRVFVAGDNRDHSSDSRVWGTLPIERILGRASVIWLSCEEALADTGQLCDPRSIRWNRFGKRVE